MQKIAALLVFAVLLGACQSKSKKEENYIGFGEEIVHTEALERSEMAALFDNLKPGDTVQAKFRTTVNEVCQMKGCWMKLDLGENESMVKFKDYGFFMPKNIAGQEVVVDGKAFVNELSVAELRHYAEDAGKSQEEIEQITAPKRTLSFEAHGVLLVE